MNSWQPRFSYKALKFHAITVTGGTLKYTRRLDQPSNIPWRITITPGGDGDVTFTFAATTDCSDDGAVCTGDERKLSNSLGLTIAGPSG